jgi:hypothetical protein
MNRRAGASAFIASAAGAAVITSAGGEQGLDAGGPRFFRTGLGLEW